jgi:glycerol-3-phosphate cytidylyltransferase
MSSGKKESGIVGFTCGAFDLLHAGHALMLEECKSHCDYLIVGVQSDPSRDRPDKNRPIMAYEERIIVVRSIRWVDEIIRYDTEKDLEEMLTKIRPDVRILGSDWKDRPFTGHSMTIKTVFNERNHNYSTRNLRRRVAMEEARLYSSSFYLTLLSEEQSKD